MTTPLEISLTGRDFLRISDLVPAEAEAILDRAVELQPLHEHGQRAEGPGDVASRREHRGFVLLQVAVVRQREALDRR